MVSDDSTSRVIVFPVTREALASFDRGPAGARQGSSRYLRVLTKICILMCEGNVFLDFIEENWEKFRGVGRLESVGMMGWKEE